MIVAIFIFKQARLAVYLKSLYIDLSLKEPILPAWVQPVAPGALTSGKLFFSKLTIFLSSHFNLDRNFFHPSARLEPELRLSSLSHGLNECISVDQLLTAIHVSQ